MQPWRAPPPPSAAQLRNILNAHVERLSFADLDRIGNDIRVIMQYHMPAGRREQRELHDKLREVEREMDFRSRNRPPPPPGPPPLPPPGY